jgi:hypothetical protein
MASSAPRQSRQAPEREVEVSQNFIGCIRQLRDAPSVIGGLSSGYGDTNLSQHMMGAGEDSIEPTNYRLASILSLLKKYNSTDAD